MKLTSKKLQNLIMEVLSEATQETQYKRIMDILQGDVESVDQVAILTPENPKAQPLSPEQNAARAKEFEKEMAAAGYGFRTVSGMYEGPEDSYMVPHMTLEDAKRYAYKYGQESFIHSSKGDDGMRHSLEYPDYSQEVIDTSYDEATFGPIMEIPPTVNISSSTPADSVLGHDDMASASDYYSHVPDKQWDAKVKDGIPRPAGEKAGKRFSIDLDFDASQPHGYDPADDLGEPKYVREAKYIFISKADVPRSMEAQKLAEHINILSKKIVESKRLGSSKYHARMRMRSMKKQLSNLIKERK
jgi:hypothetical protein